MPTLTRFDMSPLFRSAIGFDRLESLMDAALEQAQHDSSSYPPYNIEKLDEDQYRISMAVAGFDDNEINITVQDSELRVSGTKDKSASEGHEYLHRGIATRNFTRAFQLADTVRVIDAAMHNGMLHVDLVREVPEHMKPREIEIKTGSTAKGLLGMGRKGKA